MTIFKPKGWEEKVEAVMMLLLILMVLIFLTTKWDITILAVIFFLLFVGKEVRQKIRELYR